MPPTKAKIIRIGNSQGVRIPRNLLQQAGMLTANPSDLLGQEIELEAAEGTILVRRPHHPRSTWADQFNQMAQQGDDTLLDDLPTTTAWDDREWVW